MTDIVERLRKATVYEWYAATPSAPSNLGYNAAAEIERLRAALGWIEDYSIDPVVVHRANEALGGKP